MHGQIYVSDPTAEISHLQKSIKRLSYSHPKWKRLGKKEIKGRGIEEDVEENEEQLEEEEEKKEEQEEEEKEEK